MRQVPKDCLFSGLDFDKDLKGPYDYIVIGEHSDLAKISPAYMMKKYTTLAPF